jgi:hypothetical protein
MQKDVHFYLTYAMARSAGIRPQAAKEIAWANQYTDDLKEAELYGIQTQCNVGNWGNRQIQLSVLVPFHFIPGGKPTSKWPWEVTENNVRARALVEASMTRDRKLRRCAMGIALHGLQDTFSHQGFSGWREPGNSCGTWYLLPNVGHADAGHDPDVAHLTWKDPRTGKHIRNYWRVMRAAHATFSALARYNGFAEIDSEWPGLKKKVAKVFKVKDDKKRRQQLAKLAGNPRMRYSTIKGATENRCGPLFVRAAAEHLSDAMSLCAGLLR